MCCGVTDFSSDPPARSSPNRRKPSISMWPSVVQYFSHKSLTCFFFWSACDCALDGVFFCGETWFGARCAEPCTCAFAGAGSTLTVLSLPIRMSFVPETPTAQAPHHSLRSLTFIRLSAFSSGICGKEMPATSSEEPTNPAPISASFFRPPTLREDIAFFAKSGVFEDEKAPGGAQT